MITEAITVAILSLIGTAIGSFGGILSTQRLVKYRLEQLEKKQDMHNTLIERMYRLEGDFKVMGEQVHNNDVRISKIEGTSPVNSYTNSM